MHLNANGKDKTVELIRQTISTLKRKQVSNSIKMVGESNYFNTKQTEEKNFKSKCNHKDNGGCKGGKFQW
jgi:hypothetical protein